MNRKYRFEESGTMYVLAVLKQKFMQVELRSKEMIRDVNSSNRTNDFELTRSCFTCIKR